MTEIAIDIKTRDLEDLSCNHSIIFSAEGFPLDEWIEGLCIDIRLGRVVVRWGAGFGEHFNPWRPPFKPVHLEWDGRPYVVRLQSDKPQS
jgi:hypothetical protein